MRFKAKSEEYRVKLNVLSCGLEGRSYSIVTLTYSLIKNNNIVTLPPSEAVAEKSVHTNTSAYAQLAL